MGEDGEGKVGKGKERTRMSEQLGGDEYWREGGGGGGGEGNTYLDYHHLLKTPNKAYNTLNDVDEKSTKHELP